MKTLRDVVNILIFLALIAFIANSLFRIAVFYLQASP
jgi:hypothetical protein